jgi:hypothetical protein
MYIHVYSVSFSQEAGLTSRVVELDRSLNLYLVGARSIQTNDQSTEIALCGLAHVALEAYQSMRPCRCWYVSKVGFCRRGATKPETKTRTHTHQSAVAQRMACVSE